MINYKKFLKQYANYAILISILAAILLTNHEFGFKIHQYIKHLQIGFQFGDFYTSFSVKFLVENFLIVFFFYLIGLELKKETIDGQLQSKDNFLILSLAALMGIITSSISFYLLNQIFHLHYSQAWAIPITTDTAKIRFYLKCFS